MDASPLRGALEAVAEPGAEVSLFLIRVWAICMTSCFVCLQSLHRPRDGAAALGQGLVLREFRVVLERTERGAP